MLSRKFTPPLLRLSKPALRQWFRGGGEAASGFILENADELSAQGEADAKTGSDWWSKAMKWLDSAVDKIIGDFAEWQQS